MTGRRTMSCVLCATEVPNHGNRRYCPACRREVRAARIRALYATGGVRRSCDTCRELKEPGEYPSHGARRCTACRELMSGGGRVTDLIAPEWIGYHNSLTADERDWMTGSTCAACLMLRACQARVRAGEPVACERSE